MKEDYIEWYRSLPIQEKERMRKAVEDHEKQWKTVQFIPIVETKEDLEIKDPDFLDKIL